MTSNCINLATFLNFPEIIHSIQSCVSGVKAWLTNNQRQLNNDQTEMNLTASKTILNADSAPQSINLEGSDIKLANTVRNLGVCLILLSLSNSKSPPFVVSAILNFVGLVQYATIFLNMSQKKLLCAFVLSRLDYCNSFLAGCPKSLLSKVQKVQDNAARLIFRTTRSAHVTPMLHSLH